METVMPDLPRLLRRWLHRDDVSTIPPITEQERMATEAANRAKQREQIRASFERLNAAAEELRRKRGRNG